MAKGEIAHHEQFLLLSLCLEKSSDANASQTGCILKRISTYICHNESLPLISLTYPAIIGQKHFFRFQHQINKIPPFLNIIQQ